MITEILCKSALTSSKLSGLTYSLNPYIGCQHACSYCYVPSVLHRNRADWGTVISAKINIPTLLMQELRKKSKGVVGISTATDAYQPAEQHYQLTRKCLELLARHRWSVDILTKSDLVIRDLDVLEKCTNVKIGFTIPTLCEEFRARVEPHAPPISRRFSALKECSDNGFSTYVFCGPLIKKMEPSDMTKYVDAVVEAGAQELVVDTLHFKPGVWESVNPVLSEDERIMIRTRFGKLKHSDLMLLFENICGGRIRFTSAFAGY